MSAGWLSRRGESALLSVHVQPGAKTSEVAGLYGEALKVRLCAPAVDGKANAALLEFVATRLGLARSAVSLKSGQTSRSKVVAIEGAPQDAPTALYRERCGRYLRLPPGPEWTAVQTMDEK